MDKNLTENYHRIGNERLHTTDKTETREEKEKDNKKIKKIKNKEITLRIFYCSGAFFLYLICT